MEHFFLKPNKCENIAKIFLLFFTISLFFPVRHVFLGQNSYALGIYSDFTSFSLYLSDIILFIAFFLILCYNYNIIFKLFLFNYYSLFIIAWLILAIFLFSKQISGLNIWFFVKMLEFSVVTYGTTIYIFTNFQVKLWFFRCFIWLCGLQSIIALAQFFKQASLGLYRLGESHLATNILGVAKLVSYGTKYIRGYGTFPHPNPLSAFLVVGVLISVYLLTTSLTIKSKITYSILVFLNIFGLTVAFSRGAYLALGFGLVVFFGALLFKNKKIARSTAEEEASLKKSQTASLPLAISVAIMSSVVSFIVFRPFLLTRATFSDQSTIDRKFYDQMGLKMAAKQPLFGVGAGESLLHMEQTSGKTLAPWEKQPPHNYFIIAAAELGIPFALILIWIFLYHLKVISYKFIQYRNEVSSAGLKANFSSYHLLLMTLLLCFLLLMQFDHYFYTLEQTQMLLWIFLGIIAIEKTPPRGSPVGS